jgi:hypothetical protein
VTKKSESGPTVPPGGRAFSIAREGRSPRAASFAIPRTLARSQTRKVIPIARGPTDHGSGLTSAGDEGKGFAPPRCARPPGPKLRDGTGARTRAGSMTEWVPGARLVAARDAGLLPAPRLPRSRHGLTMSERCLAVNHGQPGVLLTLSAVRSRRHSYHSQADSAGSIPVTRSMLEYRCNRTVFDKFSSLPNPCFGPRPGHSGPHLSTPRHSPFSFRGRSACSVIFSGCSVFRSSNVTRACLRKFELDLNGLNYNVAENDATSEPVRRPSALDAEVPVRSPSGLRRPLVEQTGPNSGQL